MRDVTRRRRCKNVTQRCRWADACEEINAAKSEAVGHSVHSCITIFDLSSYSYMFHMSREARDLAGVVVKMLNDAVPLTIHVNYLYAGLQTVCRGKLIETHAPSGRKEPNLKMGLPCTFTFRSHISKGSFCAVSKPNFASKHS